MDAHDTLIKAREFQAVYANGHRLKEPLMKDGDMVYLCYIRAFRLIDRPLTRPCSLYIRPLFHLYPCMFLLLNIHIT